MVVWNVGCKQVASHLQTQVIYWSTWSVILRPRQRLHPPSSHRVWSFPISNIARKSTGFHGETSSCVLPKVCCKQSHWDLVLTTYTWNVRDCITVAAVSVTHRSETFRSSSLADFVLLQVVNSDFKSDAADPFASSVNVCEEQYTVSKTYWKLVVKYEQLLMHNATMPWRLVKISLDKLHELRVRRALHRRRLDHILVVFSQRHVVVLSTRVTINHSSLEHPNTGRWLWETQRHYVVLQGYLYQHQFNQQQRLPQSKKSKPRSETRKTCSKSICGLSPDISSQFRCVFFEFGCTKLQNWLQTITLNTLSIFWWRFPHEIGISKLWYRCKPYYVDEYQYY